MTLEQVKALTDEELRIKVAELLGYPDNWMRLYDWPRDLTACHLMEATLEIGEKCWYAGLLQDRLGNLDWGFATARQRCEAFVATRQE